MLDDSNFLSSSKRRLRSLAKATSACVGALGLVAAFVGQPLAAQSNDKPFADSIDVRVINLEVVVTDRAGNRVEGLNPEDFELVVDGQVVAIDYFSEIRDREAVSQAVRSDAQAAREWTGRDSTAQSTFESGTSVPTHYLVFVDEFFAVGAHRDYALDAMVEQLDRMGADDRMAIVAFDGKHLTLLSRWSGSSAHLRSTLEAAKERKARGLMRRSVRSVRGIESIPGSDGLELEREVVAVVSTLQSFADVPGRKVAMLLAGRWPTGNLSHRQAAEGSGFVDYDSTDLTITRPIVETANTLGYTLYPVDVPGLRDDRTSIDQIGPAAGAGTAASPIALNNDLFRQGALRRIAQDTGGRVMLGSDRGRFFGRVHEDTSNYYWLGFTSQRRFDDSGHSVFVRAKDRALNVRSRSGYSDLSRQAEVTMAVQGSLLFADQETPSSLPVRLGSPNRKGLNKMEVPVEMILPVDEIFLIPRGDELFAQLELRVAAVDDAGALADIPVVPIEISASSRPEDGRRLLHSVTLTLRKTAQRLVVAVTDPISGKTFANTVEIESFKSLKQDSPL